MSSVTSICPSQLFDEPIPIVGIFKLLVINFEALGLRHQAQLKKPLFNIFCFLKSFLALFFVSPSILNFS